MPASEQASGHDPGPLPTADAVRDPGDQRRRQELPERRGLLHQPHRGRHGGRPGRQPHAEHEQRGRHHPAAEREQADREVAQRGRQAAASAACPICAKAATLPSAIATKPQRSRRSGATPRCSRRPPATLPTMFIAAASAVSTAFHAGRHAGTGIDGGQEADHRHPLRRVDREGQRSGPGPDARRASRAGARPTRPPVTRPTACCARVRRHRRARPTQRRGRRQQRKRPPPARPAGPCDQRRPEQQAPAPRRAACRRPTGPARPSRRPAAPWRGSGRAPASRPAGSPGLRPRAAPAAMHRIAPPSPGRRPPAEHAGAGEHGQARQHAAAQPDRVRREPGHEAQRHARHLHQRQQEARLDQADAQ